MQVNPISRHRSPVAFKSVYVTTSTKNNGDYIEKEVIKPFERNFQTSVQEKNECKDFDELKNSTDFYILAAGEGSRFRELAKTQNEKTNKISYALPLENGENFHMLDVAMAMSVPFIDDKGLIRKNTETAKGSFAEIYDNARQLREKGLPQKNVAVCCGDNMFHTGNPFELDYFVKDVINDPEKQLGLIGVEREPEEIAGRFGVLKVIPTNKEDVMKLDGFVEKPKTAEAARLFQTSDGKCIANTGMFVIKKEAMEWLLDEMEKDPAFISRSEKEPYDFAQACTKVQAKYGSDKCDVKLVKTWEDVGEPKALYRAIEEFQDGKFLTNFSKEDREMIQSSMAKDFDGQTLLASHAALETYFNADIATIYNDLDKDKALQSAEKAGIKITDIDGVDVIV